MRPTVEFLQERFAQFNALCFGGQLPEVAIRVSKARTYLGQLRYQHKRNWLGIKKISDLTLSISARYDLPENEVEDTLIHEMIHLYILVKNLRDTSAHGPLFRGMMDSINQRFHRGISVSHRRTVEEMNQDTQKRTHYICASLLDDGRTGVTLTTTTHIFDLWRGIAVFPRVKAFKWYVCRDPWFNRFRRSRTIKVYAVDPAELRKHLATARELVMEDGRIVTKRRD